MARETFTTTETVEQEVEHKVTFCDICGDNIDEAALTPFRDPMHRNRLDVCDHCIDSDEPQGEPPMQVKDTSADSGWEGQSEESKYITSYGISLIAVSLVLYLMNQSIGLLLVSVFAIQFISAVVGFGLYHVIEQPLRAPDST